MEEELRITKKELTNIQQSVVARELKVKQREKEFCRTEQLLDACQARIRQQDDDIKQLTDCKARIQRQDDDMRQLTHLLAHQQRAISYTATAAVMANANAMANSRLQVNEHHQCVGTQAWRNSVPSCFPPGQFTGQMGGIPIFTPEPLVPVMCASVEVTSESQGQQPETDSTELPAGFMQQASCSKPVRLANRPLRRPPKKYQSSSGLTAGLEQYDLWESETVCQERKRHIEPEGEDDLNSFQLATQAATLPPPPGLTEDETMSPHIDEPYDIARCEEPFDLAKWEADMNHQVEQHCCAMNGGDLQ